MYRKGFTQVLVLVVIVAIAGYFAFKYYQSKNQVVVSPSPTTAIDSTANWKTYTIALLKLSFKYPDSVNIEELEGNIGSAAFRIHSSNEKWDNSPSVPGSLIDGFFGDVVYWKGLPKDVYQFSETKAKKVISTNNIYGLNIKGVKIKYQEYDNYVNLYYSFPEQEITVTFTIPSGKTELYEKEIDQILSTFKFTN